MPDNNTREALRFGDVPLGIRVALVEPMDDGRDNHEVRCTYYEPREGEPRFSPKFRCAYRLRTIQGTVGEPPRYDTGEHRTETEVPRLLTVVMAGRTAWGSLS